MLSIVLYFILEYKFKGYLTILWRLQKYSIYRYIFGPN